MKDRVKDYGKFNWDKPLENINEEELEYKQPITLDDGSVYVGQWSKNNKREGRGIQKWPDSTIIEGYWKNDKTHG